MEGNAGAMNDPLTELRDDPAWQEQWWRDVAARAEEWDRANPEMPLPPLAKLYEEAHDLAIDELDAMARQSRALVADQYTRIAAILREAESDPDPWVGPDPTLDPRWHDPRGRTVARVRRERLEIAVRAAAADIAVRLRLAESTVRARAAHAEVLRERCTTVWRRFLGGEVSEPNAVTAAQLALTLPDDDPESWRAFDEAIADRAATATPSRFRVAARAARERVHPEDLDTRHRRAADERRVWVDDLPDGMAIFSTLTTAAAARAAHAHVDRRARELAALPGETRTFAQLRADVAADLLQAADSAGGAASATIAVTVPALTLLGLSDESATLDGYGPIDLATAKRLAGGAASWIRILTHPVTGAPLTLDRTTYRVPKALRRWLGVVHPTCIAPGCNRPARDCDIDHRRGWAQGGGTNGDNLAPLCAHHHRLKTESLWQIVADPLSGELTFVSPTGYTSALDPPPF